jgi:hypothetical protein
VFGRTDRGFTTWDYSKTELDVNTVGCVQGGAKVIIRQRRRPAGKIDRRANLAPLLALKTQGLGATTISEALGIGRVSVCRVQEA